MKYFTYKMHQITKITLIKLFTLFAFPLALQAQVEEDTLRFDDIQYAYQNLNVLDYYQLNEEYKILQVAPGKDRVFLEDVVTVLQNKQGLLTDILDLKGFLRYVALIGKDKYSISSGNLCIELSMKTGQPKILSSHESDKKWRIGGVFPQGTLLYNPKA